MPLALGFLLQAGCPEHIHTLWRWLGRSSQDLCSAQVGQVVESRGRVGIGARALVCRFRREVKELLVAAADMARGLVAAEWAERTEEVQQAALARSTTAQHRHRDMPKATARPPLRQSERERRARGWKGEGGGVGSSLLTDSASRGSSPRNMVSSQNANGIGAMLCPSRLAYAWSTAGTGAPDGGQGIAVQIAVSIA